MKKILSIALAVVCWCTLSVPSLAVSSFDDIAPTLSRSKVYMTDEDGNRTDLFSGNFSTDNSFGFFGIDSDGLPHPEPSSIVTHPNWSDDEKNAGFPKNTNLFILDFGADWKNVDVSSSGLFDESKHIGRYVYIWYGKWSSDTNRAGTGYSWSANYGSDCYSFETGGTLNPLNWKLNIEGPFLITSYCDDCSEFLACGSGSAGYTLTVEGVAPDSLEGWDSFYPRIVAYADGTFDGCELGGYYVPYYSSSNLMFNDNWTGTYSIDGHDCDSTVNPSPSPDDTECPECGCNHTIIVECNHNCDGSSGGGGYGGSGDGSAGSIIGDILAGLIGLAQPVIELLTKALGSLGDMLDFFTGLPGLFLKALTVLPPEIADFIGRCMSLIVSAVIVKIAINFIT